MANVRIGMHVRGSDHKHLGRVVRVDGEGFVVDKGRYFVREFRVRHGEIIRVDGDTVIVAQHRSEVAELGRRRVTR